MRLIDVEVRRYGWPALRCGCGKTAEHLADDLVRLAEAKSREEARVLCIDDHALIQSFPQEAAAPVTSVLMAALAGALSHGARIQCLDLLIRLVDTDDDESSEMCQQIARQGLWGLYRDLWSGTSRDLVGYAYEILRVLETDEDRLRAYRNSGQLNLPDDLADETPDPSMGLAHAELERHDWDATRCGCGRSAGHLLATLETILAGGASGAVRSLDDHVLIQSVLMPPAPAVCAVVMAHLADGMAVAQEQEVLWLLLALVAGEVDGDSVEDSLQMRCVETVRDGLWLLYRAYLDAGGPVAKGSAGDVLEIVEWDPVRLEHYRTR